MLGIQPSPTLSIPLPCLSPGATEALLPGAGDVRETGGFLTGRSGTVHYGAATLPLGDRDCADPVRDLYRNLFRLTDGLHLYRIWNFLPHINRGEGDDERYRRFNLGRSEAFLEAFGNDSASHMPSGTCVGCEGDRLVLYFLAGGAPPDHHENTKQVPAYRYPREYGRLAPSFARATTVTIAPRRHLFTSGTASILGHRSVGEGDITKQLAVTCDNLERLFDQTDTPIHASSPVTRGKVYLRNAVDYEMARTYLEGRLPAIAHNLIYLQADICRKELLVEIELHCETEA